jgi:prolyl oligopeptidase
MDTSRRLRAPLAAALLLVSPLAARGAGLEYPRTQKVDQVDDYHGTKVADPYRWLEQDVRESPDVAAWVEAENAVTFPYLEALPGREAITQRLTELWDYEKYGTPFKKGGRYYFFKNDGLQNQYVLYVQDSLDAEPEVLIDPNTWSEDGTVALGETAFSKDGRYVAYGIQESGSDWRTWRVMDIASRKLLDDELKWIKFSDVAWAGDSSGFFYGRYDEPEAGSEFQSLNLDMEVYYHRIGAPQSRDILVHRRVDHPDWGFGATVSDDGRYLILSTWKGTDARNRVSYRDLTEPYAGVITLIDTFDEEYTFLGNEGTVFYFQTSFEAPLRRVIAIDTNEPEPENWREIVPQSADTLLAASMVGDRIIGRYLQDAKSAIRIYDLAGKWQRDVELPGIGAAFGFGGDRADDETFYSFSSFTTPPSIYRYELASGESTLLRRSQVDFDPDDYTVSQVFYESKDGTRVPMFLAHKKGIPLDGHNATLLYGYGGFDISLFPSFSISKLAWMEMGGVYAQANLRGGGEYGEPWHEAGTKLHKQNVFDDFIAAGEWLIANGYTRSDRLGIQGGSNGGLLIGAAITQRPDLFGAALPAVGVMDMLRFHKFTAGRFWVDDYGSSDDPEQFAALYAYSPYHNLEDGTHYPPTLVTTADHDDRVVPGHSFKFAARIQEAQAGDAPVLIRIETKAGHGSGKPTSKWIEEIADQWAFLAYHLELKDRTNR